MHREASCMGADVQVWRGHQYIDIVTCERTSVNWYHCSDGSGRTRPQTRKTWLTWDTWCLNHDCNFVHCIMWRLVRSRERSRLLVRTSREFSSQFLKVTASSAMDKRYILLGIVLYIQAAASTSVTIHQSRYWSYSAVHFRSWPRSIHRQRSLHRIARK
jgi:hypothetical protein